ncbi:calcium-binding protein [Streptomyces sp. NRRL B-3648]|uniref:calcium-binding protein n=1 Tax=Streptomyces sp. NRRL B-3648 TaxID=1519493 RepID=UPI0006AF6E37|nr:calcium-binding protein [Streptomyces sp. NRRL B-3648]KOV91916.1 calcium-binding protein [Streptomyces sp. NRRL B-3648]
MPVHTHRMRPVRALALAAGTAAALAVPFGLPGTAAAATAPATAAVNQYDWQLTYQAATGQANKATVTASLTADRTGITYLIDDTVTIEAGHGCAHPDGADRTKVSCTVTGVDSQDPYAALVMNLGDRNDTVAYRNATGQIYSYARISLGSGNDRATDSGRLDGAYLSGDAGDDTLTVGKEGLAWGGDGNDTVHASGGDNIVRGGRGDDVLRGGAGSQDLAGDDGDDTVHGGSGADTLNGGKGDDRLYGDGGDDRLYGNSGDDRLYGGAGRDTLSGGPGRDVVHQD